MSYSSANFSFKGVQLVPFTPLSTTSLDTEPSDTSSPGSQDDLPSSSYSSSASPSTTSMSPSPINATATPDSTSSSKSSSISPSSEMDPKIYPKIEVYHVDDKDLRSRHIKRICET